MLSALKRIFGKGPAARPVVATAPSPSPAVASEPAPASRLSRDTTLQPAPARRESTTQWRRAPKPDEVAVSFRAIFPQVPSELRGRLGSTSAGHTVFFLPRSRVIEQLAQGAVKVPFGELRRAAPLGLFVNNSDHDHQLIPLPLHEILSQLSPQAFARRPDQRPWQEPEGVPDIFGPKGQQRAALRIVSKTELKRAPVSPPSASASQPAATAAQPHVGPAPSGTAAPAAPQPVRPSPVPLKPPIAPGPASVADKVGGTKKLSPPDSSGASGPAPTAQPREAGAGAAGTPTTEVPPDTLLVPVEELAAAWPESVKQELERLGCAQAECALPINEITEPLKAGRIAVRLERLLGWVVPKPSGRCAAQLGDTVLELPLQTVVPRYFARYKLPPKPKKIVPSDSVPDLFTKEGRLNKAPQAQPGGPAPLAQHAPDSAEPDGRAQPGALIFSLRELSAQWPESVKQELARFNLEEAQVHVPLDVAEKHLRQGKVEFSWKELCAWIKNCPQSVPSQLTAELRVELPLPVVAPRFIKVRPPPTPPTPAEVAPDIPDLFGPGKPLSGVSASQPREVKTSVVSRSAAPSSTPARAPELPGSAAGAAPQPAKKLPKDIAELFGEPDKSVWTPNELVQKTACLPGVAGALIALQDGLLVAECMPPNWKPETIAAFLPQIFGRMNQYARELAMGELRSLTFTVEGGSLQIFAAGIIYFAALGKPGVPLPQLELNLIATELSRHTK